MSIKTSKQQLLDNFYKVINNKDDFYIWGGGELIQEINKKVKRNKILNLHQLGHLIRLQRQFLVFNNYNSFQYIFVKKRGRKKK